MIFLYYVFVAMIAMVGYVNGSGYDDGNWDVVEWDIGEQVKPLLEYAPYHIHVWAPTECYLTCGPFKDLKFPVMLFVSGFSGQIDLAQYQTTMKGVAAHGIVVIGVDQTPGLTPGTNDFPKLAAYPDPVLRYIQGTTDLNLAADLVSRGAIKAADTKKIFYAGHSAGVHTLLSRIDLQIARSPEKSKTCDEAGAIIMLSPIDGQDPFGFGKEYAINSRKAMNYSIPALMIWGELDGVPGDSANIACALDGFGGERFLKYWRGQLYSVKAKGIGHLDYVDEGKTSLYTTFCKTGSDATLKAKFRAAVKGMIVSFIDHTVTTSTPPIKTLKDKETLGIEIEYQEDKSEVSSSSNFQCTVDIKPDPLAEEIELGIILGIVAFVVIVVIGFFSFVRRLDMDTRDDWLVKVDSDPIVAGTAMPGGPMLQPQGSYTFTKPNDPNNVDI